VPNLSGENMQASDQARAIARQQIDDFVSNDP
jgi:hypothetical protein